MVADGDRRPNWEFYQHLWLSLLMDAEAQADDMDTGLIYTTTPIVTVCASVLWPLIQPDILLAFSASM